MVKGIKYDGIQPVSRQCSQERCGKQANRHKGNRQKDLLHICDFAVSPGYSDEILHIYYASDFEEVDRRLDEDEFLSVEWIDKKIAIQMAINGEIQDGKTLTALLWYQAKFGAL